MHFILLAALFAAPAKPSRPIFPHGTYSEERLYICITEKGKFQCVDYAKFLAVKAADEAAEAQKMHANDL
jgi:hypothetical protein